MSNVVQATQGESSEEVLKWDWWMLFSPVAGTAALGLLLCIAVIVEQSIVWGLILFVLCFLGLAWFVKSSFFPNQYKCQSPDEYVAGSELNAADLAQLGALDPELEMTDMEQLDARLEKLIGSDAFKQLDQELGTTMYLFDDH